MVRIWKIKSNLLEVGPETGDAAEWFLMAALPRAEYILLEQHPEEVACTWGRGRTDTVGQCESVPEGDMCSVVHSVGGGWWLAGSGLELG